MAMMHTGLVQHYERIFAFKQYHGWTVTEIEDLMPWDGKRAQAGRMPPNGFPKNNKFD